MLTESKQEGRVKHVWVVLTACPMRPVPFQCEWGINTTPTYTTTQLAVENFLVTPLKPILFKNRRGKNGDAVSRAVSDIEILVVIRSYLHADQDGKGLASSPTGCLRKSRKSW